MNFPGSQVTSDAQVTCAAGEPKSAGRSQCCCGNQSASAALGLRNLTGSSQVRPDAQARCAGFGDPTNPKERT